MNVKINYLPGFKNVVANYLSRNLQEQDPCKPLNSFHISSITLQNDSFPNEFINLMHNDGKLETLFTFECQINGDGGGVLIIRWAGNFLCI